MVPAEEAQEICDRLIEAAQAFKDSAKPYEIVREEPFKRLDEAIQDAKRLFYD